MNPAIISDLRTVITSDVSTSRQRLGDTLGCPHFVSVFESRQCEQYGTDLDLIIYFGKLSVKA